MMIVHFELKKFTTLITLLYFRMYVNVIQTPQKSHMLDLYLRVRRLILDH